jgi:hypothetical protein
MNIKNLVAASALAVVTATSGYAATAVDTPDAVLLGFRATADASVGANSFLFVGLNGFQTQSFAFNNQLVSQFGADWYSNGYIRWGVYGVNINEDTDNDGNYINYGKTTVGSVTNSGLALADGNWDYVVPASTVLDGVKNNLVAAGLSETTGGYSYGSLTGGDAAPALGLASAFQGLISKRYPIVAEFDLSDVTSLDINRFLPNADINDFGFYSIPGIVSIASSGQISVVPEPSTYVLLGLGAVMALAAMRRSKRA